MSKKEKFDKYELSEYTVAKSGDLVHAKYRSTDLEYDVAQLGLTRIQKVFDEEGKEDLVAKLYPNDINRLVDRKKNIYRDLKSVAAALPSHTMVIESKKGNGFVAFSMMPRVDYEDNVLTIHYSEVLKPHLLGLTGNFEVQNIAITTLLKGYAKRIYEILNFHAFKIPAGGCYHVTYRVSELKFMLGIANMDEAAVKRKIASYKKDETIDYDYLYDHVVIEKMFERWDHFSAKVLKKAQAELKEKADLCFEFKGIREGHETKKVEFSIFRNNPEIKWQDVYLEKMTVIKEEQSEDYKQITLFESQYPLLTPYLGHNMLSEDDLILLMERARGDSDLVIRAINAADKQKKIHNYMGWIVKYIDAGGYSEPIEVEEGSVEDAQINNEIHADINSNDMNSFMWTKLKEREDFKGFLEENGLTVEMIDTLYENPNEKVSLFFDWKRSKLGKKTE